MIEGHLRVFTFYTVTAHVSSCDRIYAKIKNLDFTAFL